MNRPGDWNCRGCQHLNFQRRDSCQRCGEPRTGGGGDYFGGFGGGGGGGGMMRGGGSSSFGFGAGPDVRPGDWYCGLGNCGAHNFASRSTCFKCGALKDDSSLGGAFDAEMSRPRAGAASAFGFGGGVGGGATTRSAWKSGDWICSRAGCNEHNFASRMECFRCTAPREFGNNTSSYFS